MKLQIQFVWIWTAVWPATSVMERKSASVLVPLSTLTWEMSVSVLVRCLECAGPIVNVYLCDTNKTHISFLTTTQPNHPASEYISPKSHSLYTRQTIIFSSLSQCYSWQPVIEPAQVPIGMRIKAMDSYTMEFSHKKEHIMFCAGKQISASC